MLTLVPGATLARQYGGEGTAVLLDGQLLLVAGGGGGGACGGDVSAGAGAGGKLTISIQL